MSVAKAVTDESLEDAAASGELIVNALPGPVALETLTTLQGVASRQGA